jgi:hypothetical protein
MIYSEYTYLYPPRPETPIAKALLGFYEKRKWVGQLKKNGTCTLIFAKGNEVIFKTRHADDHRLWTPLQSHVDYFSGHNDWSVYVAELIHSKVTGGRKNHLYIFDKIVHNGEQLIGMKFSDRYSLIEGMPQNENISIAKLITTDFVKVYDNLGIEDEGLVLKDPNHKLNPCWREGLNSAGQVKCRIKAKNYSF